MGTTRDALTAGSLSYVYVVAVEGYPHLLTNHGDPTKVVAAWSGTDWTSAIGGLFVDLDRSQTFHPLRAFDAGGKCTLRVAPDAADTFGIDLAATARGEYTYLAASIDCDATTIPVKDASNLPASGTAYIGTECIAYTGNTGATLTGATRGKFSPFANGQGGRFGRPHRAGLVSALNMSLEPVVSQYRRGSWIGSLVGVWICRVLADGTVDTRAQAQLVFAGTIAETRDDGETGHAAIECVDILARVRGASLVRDQYKAKIGDGIWIRQGQTFKFSDKRVAGTAVTSKTANPLVCTAVWASTNTIVEGYYTVESLASTINVWLSAEYQAGRIYGVYNLIAPCEVLAGYQTTTAPTGSFRTNMQWLISHTSGGTGTWSLSVPHEVAAFLGVTEKYDPSQQSGSHTSWGDSDTLSAPHHEFSEFAPLRWYVPDFLNKEHRVRLVDEEGIAWDNYAWMPTELPSPDPTYTVNGQNTIGTLDPTLGTWGIFTIGGKPFLVGALAVGAYGPEIRAPRRFYNHEDLNVRYEPNVTPAKVEIAQVYALHAPWSTIVASIFYSTGTAAFNHATYDQLPQTLSLALPGELLGAAFDSSILNAPEGSDWMTMIVERPLTLEKLLNVDLVLRGMHLVWKDQGLRFRQWETPIASNAVATLTETNKALPATNRGSHRAPTTQTTEWLTPIVKVMFAREWTADAYTDGPLVLEDRTAIDDLGGQAPEKTLEARNMTRAQVMAIAPLFLARMPNISRPAWKTRRTIAQTLFETLTPGDCVLLTDGFARDPVTGTRQRNGVGGLVQQPALVVGVRYALGGPNPGNVTQTTPQLGEVDLITYPGKRFAPYCPSARVNETVGTGGFTAGYASATKTLALKAHEHTESTDVLHDVNYFAAGDTIRIVEVDPVNPASPLVWDRAVLSTGADTLVLDTALASPAFNAARRYRICARSWTDAVTNQRRNAFQADEATAKIAGTGEPYHYGGAVAPTPYTAEDATAPSELVAELHASDGAARDVGAEVALLRTLDNLFDHKVARNSPGLRAVITQTGHAGYRMVAVSDKWFGRVVATAASPRSVSIAPRFRSGTGASVTVRVTLCRGIPIASTLDDVSFAAPFESHTWTTTSTTWQDGTPADFDLAIVGSSGIGTIIIEATQNAEVRGLAKCRQGARG